MTLAASFLGGAKGRLLPASVPFRFFAAAVVFHLLLWVSLLASAEELTHFRGGLGPALASIHLLTLGILAMTAIGAAVQLLPVATRRSLAAVWPIKLVFWLAVPGLALLIFGMWTRSPAVLLAGSLAAAAGLLLFAVLLADNLRRAGSMPVVAAYGWSALAALVGLVLLGVALSVDYLRAFLPDHGAAALAHMILGGYGFMGFLALGFSHVLVPMFALAAAPPKAPSLIAFALASGGLILGTAGALAGDPAILTVALAAGAAAALVHIRLMMGVLRGGMRKRLGLSFVLIRAGWAMLLASFVVGLAALFGLAGANGATLFGLVLIGGWLLTFLLGVLQRILPFLASMHAARSQGGLPPLLSELGGERSLQVHAAAHALALALVGLGIAIDAPALVQAGAAAGTLGALAFALFAGSVITRALRTAPPRAT
jgi:hypothetical protein